MIKILLKKVMAWKILQHVIFLVALWFSVYFVLDGYDGWHYDNRPEPSVLASWGAILAVVAIYVNPFFNFFKTRAAESVNVEKLTGLHEYYWKQARGLVLKHGNDATVKLALRESDDFLTDNQRMDLAKSRFAADLLLKLQGLEKKTSANACEQ